VDETQNEVNQEISPQNVQESIGFKTEYFQNSFQSEKLPTNEKVQRDMCFWCLPEYYIYLWNDQMHVYIVQIIVLKDINPTGDCGDIAPCSFPVNTLFARK